jgi:hypothetical protein
MSAIAHPALALACILWIAPALPPNIHVDSALTNIVHDMLLHSPIFRGQCARLQRVTRVRIRLTVDLRGIGHRTSSRAESELKRYQYGFIDATVRLRSIPQAEELIAHELEHVLEYIDGVKHREAWRRDPREVWLGADGRFETARAIDTGRRVAAELTRSRSARLTEPR